jgi:hypothetical protein
MHWQTTIADDGGRESKEKYYIALGQSPEAIALMKTDPLRFGSKVSKIE